MTNPAYEATNSDVEKLIARKGNAVTGNYYLAECGNCSEMFPSERMTGGEALYAGDYGDCYCPHCDTDDSEIIDCGVVNSSVVEAWNFQQKHIDALISELEQALQENKEQAARIEELESQRKLAFTACNRWRDKCVDAEKSIAELEKTLHATEEGLIAAVDHVTELEAAPNGMMQLSNELAAKSVVIGELGFLENLERIISERDRDIDIGQLGHENYQALMVAALDAFRSAAGQVKGNS